MAKAKYSIEQEMIFKENIRLLRLIFEHMDCYVSYSYILENADIKINLKRLQRLCSPTLREERLNENDVKCISSGLQKAVEDSFKWSCHEEWVLPENFKIEPEKMLQPGYAGDILKLFDQPGVYPNAKVVYESYLEMMRG